MLYPDKQPSFQDIFVTYCDINDLKITSARQELIDMIISQKHTSLVTYHKWGFLRYYFDKLIKSEISLEQFMTMGDIEGQIKDQINPHVYQEEYPALLEILNPDIVSSWTKDSLIIIDPLIRSYYNNQYTPGQNTAIIISLSN